MNIRTGKIEDRQSVTAMYRDVANILGGLARIGSEVTNEYIENWMTKSLSTGLWLVGENPTKEIVGSIHAYRFEPLVFSHVLSELTIAIHPSAQGKGLGKALFGHFLKKVQTNYPNILRVELIARESNQNAIHMYESLGFKKEGRFEKRIRSAGTGYEADIPMAWVRP